MAHEIDWLNSQAGMCKINFYSSAGQKDQERKVICFVDVANLNFSGQHANENIANSQPSNISDPARELNLANLEEREVIIIKDNEQSNHVNTEGAVCLFKQGSSEDVNVLGWLSNDLQKYAIGFQHALTPMGTPRKATIFDKGSQNNNNTAASASRSDRDDMAYYANKLCSMVIEMTRKEIMDKWERSGKCIRQTISPHSASSKAAERTGGSEPPSEQAVKMDDPFAGEATSQNDYKQQEAAYSDKVRKQDDVNLTSKGMMVYANQVASDMMLSFLKTMKVQKGRHPVPACIVLKEVLVRHVKEIVSDLIDSSMKNLHNITGALMTDSDFVCGLKRNVYNVGTQKTAEILEAMVRRLFKLITGDDRQTRAQSLAFTTYKSGAQLSQRAQGMQFASLKSESHGQGKKDRGGGPGKSLPSGSKAGDKHSVDVYAKELLLTALMQIQQHLLEKNRDTGLRESNTSAFGCIHQDPHPDQAGGSREHKNASKSSEGRAEHYHADSLKDKGGLLLSVVQKILHDIGLNLDNSFGDKNRG
ncbi:A-kinase anchor protein 4 [Varanus komodoensis]|uniref:A-kinase anchor protein 4-like n=1 Tax=Varanus komodoensis TaxID=61221 RepID=UPI001CF7E705|nr:A-kinase anchor protein 4-like [Varanus komodoensis]KAF7241899.1 A-kinase anchor protein 4 [Varanus komodoensis]